MPSNCPFCLIEAVGINLEGTVFECPACKHRFHIHQTVSVDHFDFIPHPTGEWGTFRNILESAKTEGEQILKARGKK